MGELGRFDVPTRRGGTIVPGLPVLPLNVERYPIPGGGSRVVPIDAGDEITVVDREGLQIAELVFFDENGASSASMIGGIGAGAPTGLQAMLLSGDLTANRVRLELDKRGLDLGQAEAVRLFQDGSQAGDRETLIAKTAGTLIIAAPGGPMEPDAQNPVTEITLYVKREARSNIKILRGPPDPLADPIEDFNLDPGVAKSYRVRKGEYIQILDVQGRECSDFQCFSLADLDRGLERELDGTTTRSMYSTCYPTPGLFAKFWTVDMRPLVEVVQDTCGRHDTFGLACTARSYEDMGYPGHVNCTDNINIEMAAYNIRERRGWPAINFFFNTMIDDLHTLDSDEPWSRPGDYVLLRALEDLICVSTACPADTSAANAWNPTDIQVRTYSDKELFKTSIGYRKTAEADMEETRKSGFHDCFSRHTRDFGEVNGFWVANQMTNHGVIEEYWATREKAAIMDMSGLRKYEVLGPDAEDLMQLCVTRNMKKLSIGQVVYTAMCYDHGGMIDDGTVLRLGDHNFRWIGGNDTSGLWLREQAEARGMNVHVKTSTDQLCNIALQGPKSREILSQVFWTGPQHATIEELGWFRFTVARVGEFHGAPTVVSRTGYSGELGYEVFCHPKDAETVFDAIWAAGEPHGLTPIGFDALNICRVEAGLALGGHEFCDQTDPFEAGIGFTVPLKSKTDDFIGRDALVRRKDNPQRKLVGLAVEGREVPRHGDCIRIGRAQVGEVTSAVNSPSLDKVIALARVDVSVAEEGRELEIGQLDGQQKRLLATVVRFPHFDPTKERVKGNYS